MDHISAHLAEKQKKREPQGGKKTVPTERGELMEYFRGKLNYSRVQDGLQPLSMPRMGRILEAIPTKDLYFLKSVCDQAKNFSKKFWWEINPKNHESETKAAGIKKHG